MTMDRSFYIIEYQRYCHDLLANKAHVEDK